MTYRKYAKRKPDVKPCSYVAVLSWRLRCAYFPDIPEYSPLPDFPWKHKIRIKSIRGTNNKVVELAVNIRDQWLHFRESTTDFPSQTLLTQLTMVA